MKFICVQPAIDYYTWQVEVMINNFIKNGVTPSDIEIVCAHYGAVPQKWQMLVNAYKGVKFFFYRDTRVKPAYISSVRPHILHKHWLANPSLQLETIFYCDCDILLSKPFDTEGLLDNQNCYVSDTVSYIGADYIRSKGEHYLDLMTTIVGVNKEFVANHNSDSGGAQYLLKRIPTDFWAKVYYDSESLFRIVTEQIKKDKAVDPKIHDLQIWCADMWAVLWNLWFFNKTVLVTDKMSFSWATSAITEWEKHPIFHNAGVVNGGQKMFYKAEYRAKLPYDITLDEFSTDRCSYKYAEEIVKTKEVTCLS